VIGMPAAFHHREWIWRLHSQGTFPVLAVTFKGRRDAARTIMVKRARPEAGAPDYRIPRAADGQLFGLINTFDKQR